MSTEVPEATPEQALLDYLSASYDDTDGRLAHAKLYVGQCVAGIEASTLEAWSRVEETTQQFLQNIGLGPSSSGQVADGSLVRAAHDLMFTDVERLITAPIIKAAEARTGFLTSTLKPGVDDEVTKAVFGMLSDLVERIDDETDAKKCANSLIRHRSRLSREEATESQADRLSSLLDILGEQFEAVRTIAVSDDTYDQPTMSSPIALAGETKGRPVITGYEHVEVNSSFL